MSETDILVTTLSVLCVIVQENETTHISEVRHLILYYYVNHDTSLKIPTKPQVKYVLQVTKEGTLSMGHIQTTTHLHSDM